MTLLQISPSDSLSAQVTPTTEMQGEQQILMLIAITGGLLLICVILLVVVLIRNKNKKKKAQQPNVSATEVTKKPEPKNTYKEKVPEVVAEKKETVKEPEPQKQPEVKIPEPVKTETPAVTEKIPAAETIVKKEEPVSPPQPEIPEKEEIKKPEPVAETPKEVTGTPPKDSVRSEKEMKDEVWKAMNETASREENLRKIQERLKEIMGDGAPETPPVADKIIPAPVQEKEETKPVEPEPAKEEIIQEDTVLPEDVKPLINAQFTTYDDVSKTKEKDPENIYIEMPEEEISDIMLEQPDTGEEIIVPFVPEPDEVKVIPDLHLTPDAEDIKPIIFAQAHEPEAPEEQEEPKEPEVEETPVSEPEITPAENVNKEVNPKTFTEWLNSYGGIKKK